jgi:hypothetical protein
MMANTDKPSIDISVDVVCQSVCASFAAAKENRAPYTYWEAHTLLPDRLVGDICALPFEAPDLGGVSGKREKHNATRTYFDAANRAAFEVVNTTALAFQSSVVTGAIEETFQTNLSGSYLRMEYAQDIDGFWLQPHSDLGVKLFTLLLYLSDDPAHSGLGTDIYDDDKRHIGAAPFIPNSAMIFVPSDDTFHGFEKRPIKGVRKSLIINYVTDAWIARNQLAFPDRPIGS